MWVVSRSSVLKLACTQSSTGRCFTRQIIAMMKTIAMVATVTMTAMVAMIALPRLLQEPAMEMNAAKREPALEHALNIHSICNQCAINVQSTAATGWAERNLLVSGIWLVLRYLTPCELSLAGAGVPSTLRVVGP